MGIGPGPVVLLGGFQRLVSLDNGLGKFGFGGALGGTERREFSPGTRFGLGRTLRGFCDFLAHLLELIPKGGQLATCARQVCTEFRGLRLGLVAGLDLLLELISRDPLPQDRVSSTDLVVLTAVVLGIACLVLHLLVRAFLLGCRLA